MKELEFKNIEDFILNESFREFVTNTNPASVMFWERWIADHSNDKIIFEKAVEILQILLNTRKQDVPLNKNEEWAALLSKIELTEIKPKKYYQLLFESTWIKIAAILIISVIISVAWNWFYSHKAQTNLAYCEVIVPIGEKSQIILPDGSHVWINSGSHFKYPVLFGDKSREVFLQGEAYFDVKKQNGKTFVVNTSDVKVKVLGTAFNVKCYPGDNKTSTTVVRGLVEVQRLIGKKEISLVEPNKMAVVYKKDQEKNLNNSKPEKPIIINQINPEVITSWKDQLLVFSDETLEDMAVKMERWFNIRIIIPDEKLKSERYNGKFVRNETIYQVLEAIKLTSPITYTVHENEIIITRK